MSTLRPGPHIHTRRAQDFTTSLGRLTAGGITLLDEFDAQQIAIQTAIRRAFSTPEVMKLFAAQEPGQLRLRISQLLRDDKLGRIDKEVCRKQVTECIVALRQLGEEVRALPCWMLCVGA